MISLFLRFSIFFSNQISLSFESNVILQGEQWFLAAAIVGISQRSGLEAEISFSGSCIEFSRACWPYWCGILSCALSTTGRIPFVISSVIVAVIQTFNICFRTLGSARSRDFGHVIFQHQKCHYNAVSKMSKTWKIKWKCGSSDWVGCIARMSSASGCAMHELLL